MKIRVRKGEKDKRQIKAEREKESKVNLDKIIMQFELIVEQQ